MQNARGPGQFDLRLDWFGSVNEIGSNAIPTHAIEYQDRGSPLKLAKRDHQSDTSARATSAPLWLGRLLVIGLLFYAPWYYGMVTWSQQLLLLPWATAIMAVTWLHAWFEPNIKLRLPLLVLSLFALIGIAFIQIIPLPQSVYETWAPSAKFERAAVEQAANYLSMEASDPSLLKVSQESGPLFRTLSIHPWQTRTSLVGFSTAVIVLLCSSLLFQDKFGKLTLLIALALVSTALATIGIMQNISWNRWTLLEMPRGYGFATFVSHNSAPQYLAIGIGSTIALAVVWLSHQRKKTRYDKRYRGTTAIARMQRSLDDSFRLIDARIILLVVALLLQIGGVVGSASRGGFIALLFALLVTLLLTLSRNKKMIVPGIAGITFLSLVSVVFLNSFELTEGVSSRLKTEGLSSPIRFEIWKAALGQSEYWLTGSGLGNFHFAMLPANQSHPEWVYHAESVFVELMSDFGMLGALAGLLGLTWLILQLFRRPEPRTNIVWTATLYAVCAIGLHSTVDFSLIIPAIFLSLAALVGAFLAETDDLNRPRRSSAATSENLPRVSRRFLLSLISMGLLASLWQGAGPLLGFAQAEKISSPFWSNTRASLTIPGLPQIQDDLSHPEVVLQLARHKVIAAEEYVHDQVSWPADVPPEQRDRLSRMEFVSSIIRSSQPEQLEGLKAKWENDKQLSQAIESSRKGFEYMARFCPLDWRGHWGLLQTSSSSTPLRRALTCARLKRLTISLPLMQQAVGTCELLAGDRAIGMDFWKESLGHHPKQANRIAVLVDTWLDKEDLLQILPNSEIPKVILIRALVNDPKTRTMGEEFLSELELAKLRSEATNETEWDLVVWVSQMRNDSDLLIDALRKVANFRPMDKAVRVRLAEALESIGSIDEAIRLMEQASRRTVLDSSDEALLLRLRQAKTPPLTE